MKMNKILKKNPIIKDGGNIILQEKNFKCAYNLLFFPSLYNYKANLITFPNMIT